MNEFMKFSFSFGAPVDPKILIDRFRMLMMMMRVLRDDDNEDSIYLGVCDWCK